MASHDETSTMVRSASRCTTKQRCRSTPSWHAAWQHGAPGRADITEDEAEDPVTIPDLWGLQHYESLTQAGTIRHVGPVALALRQEDAASSRQPPTHAPATTTRVGARHVHVLTRAAAAINPLDGAGCRVRQSRRNTFCRALRQLSLESSRWRAGRRCPQAWNRPSACIRHGAWNGQVSSTKPHARQRCCSVLSHRRATGP